MKKYYLDRTSRINGSNAVHSEDCPFLPGKEQRIALGMFKTCKDALKTARIISLNADGCYFCQKEHSAGYKAEAEESRFAEIHVLAFSEN